MATTSLGFKHILVPTDFGEPAVKALDVAVDLARKYNAAITLLHVYEVPVYPYPGTPVDIDLFIRDAAQKELDRAFAALKRRDVEAQSELVYGVPWNAILEAAEHRNADLIVMGTHGRRGVRHALIGSVAEKVVRLSRIPVLTVGGSEVSQARQDGDSPARPAQTSR